MARDRRRDAATATVGATGVAGGGVLRHRAVERAIPKPAGGEKVYPRLHAKAVFGAGGDRRARALYIGGNALGLLSTAPLAVGLHNSLKDPLHKRDGKSFLREGLEGSATALQERGDNLRQPIPAKVRGAQLAVAGGAGYAGSGLARLALKNKGRLKPGLAPLAGALVATGTIPLSNKVVSRVHPDYEVTPTGVKRAKKAPKRPSSMSSRYVAQPRSLQADLAKRDRTDYAAQRAAVTGAGAVPIAGPLIQAATAGRYAPPGQQRKHAARQFGMGPAGGFAAGTAAAYGGAHLAEKSPRFEAGAKKLTGFADRVEGGVRSTLRLPEKKPLDPLKFPGRTVARLKATKAAAPLLRNKTRSVGAAAGFLGVKAAVGSLGGQTAITLNQRDQKAWRKTAVGKQAKPAEGSLRDQHKAAQRKKLNAALSTTTGVGGLAGLALLASPKTKRFALPTSLTNGAIAGTNSLIYGGVARRDAKIADPFDPLSKRAVKSKAEADVDLQAFALELRAAGLRLRPSAPVQVKPLRRNKTLARVKTMDAEDRERYFSTKSGRKWMTRNGLGRAGTMTWGPTDGATNTSWRQRSGFTGAPRPKNITGYRGSGKPYGMSKGYLPSLPYKGPKYVHHTTLGRLRIVEAHPNGRFTVDSPSGSRLMHRDHIWPKKPKPDDGQMSLFDKGLLKLPSNKKLKFGPAVKLPKSQVPKANLLPKDKIGKFDNRPPLKTSVSEDDARKLVDRHGLKGPLPKTLDRQQKMAAYEARYVSAGGKKAEHWQHRAQRADKIKTAGLAGATAGGAVWLAGRGRLGRAVGRTITTKAPGLRHVDPKKISHHSETVVGASAVAGGAGELYAGHARRKRSSYASAPAGVAASALRRMQDYTPSEKS